MFKPTQQQQKVIDHVEGHARVLAIAGSGKTTTMVFRIKNLIEKHNVDPKRIRILMFNSAAASDFKKKLDKHLQGVKPRANTFHSFSYQLIQSATKEGDIPNYSFWINEHEYEHDKCLHKAIGILSKEGLIDFQRVDFDEINKSISLWKGALIKPENAGHIMNEDYPLIYQKYEELRSNAKALTYDDFVPECVELLTSSEKYKKLFTKKIEHLIVDEYQDVNIAQQKLLEILASTHANVMVVGDDDQTIYEWRGARPDYILTEFETTFTNKNHSVFYLDRTFRFGPLIAQCAENSIHLNIKRHKKSVFANNFNNLSNIEVYESSRINRKDPNELLTKEILKLVKEDKVEPNQIRIIGRLYSQLTGLEGWFINKKVPYQILDNVPFFKRREITILLHYLKVINSLNSPLTKDIRKSIDEIINTPNRKINKSTFNFELDKYPHISLKEFLENQNSSHVQLEEFIKFLNDGYSIVQSELKKEKFATKQLLEWIYTHSKLEEHYLNYFGKGDAAKSKIDTTKGFLNFIHFFNMQPDFFLEYINRLDSTFGLPENKLITMSTVHKTKGLEFDYVVIPDCADGNMPFISDNQLAIFDKKSPTGSIKLSESLESERRLFYVAITRGMKKVFIGASLENKTSRFLEEIMKDRTYDILVPLLNNQINSSWLEKIHSIAGFKWIMENLKKYLKEMDQNELRHEVEEINIQYEKEEFSYQDNYPIEQIGEETDSEDPWERIEI